MTGFSLYPVICYNYFKICISSVVLISPVNIYCKHSSIMPEQKEPERLKKNLKLLLKRMRFFQTIKSGSNMINLDMLDLEEWGLAPLATA